MVRLDIWGVGRWDASNYDDLGGFHDGTFPFSDVFLTEIEADRAYEVEMLVASHGQGEDGFSYDSSAYLDPSIEIDPAFEYYDQFKVVHSAGISFVPLPGSLILLGSALIPLIRRKKAL